MNMNYRFIHLIASWMLMIAAIRFVMWIFDDIHSQGAFNHASKRVLNMRPIFTSSQAFHYSFWDNSMPLSLEFIPGFSQPNDLYCLFGTSLWLGMSVENKIPMLIPPHLEIKLISRSQEETLSKVRPAPNTGMGTPMCMNQHESTISIAEAQAS